MVSSELLDAGGLPAADRSMGRPDPHEDGSVGGGERGQHDVLAAEDVDDGRGGEVVGSDHLGGRWWRWRVRWRWRWWRVRWWWQRFGCRWRICGRWSRRGLRFGRRRLGGRRRFGCRWRICGRWRLRRRGRRVGGGGRGGGDGGDRLQHGVSVDLAEAALQEFTGGGEQPPRGLACHAELAPRVERLVPEHRERRDPGLVDELPREGQVVLGSQTGHQNLVPVISSELLDAGCLPAANRSMRRPEPQEDRPVGGRQRGQHEALAADDVHDGDRGEVIGARRGRRRWRLGCGRRISGRLPRGRWRFGRRGDRCLFGSRAGRRRQRGDGQQPGGERPCGRQCRRH